jgi:hypothetical protein
MHYKTGDKVKIKSLDWYNENKDEVGGVYGDSYAIFIQTMTKFCGQIVTISEVVDDVYGILEDYDDYSWADYMIECLIEPAVENKPQEKMVSLDDVCRFLDEHLYTSTSTGDYDYGQEYICSDFDNATDLIFALRKAMGE